MLKAFLKRDLLGVWRESATLWRFIFMMIIALTLLVISLGPEQELLKKTGAGVFWTLLTILSLLQSERMLVEDFEEGTLDLLFTLPLSTELYVFSKAIAQWITVALPGLLLLPLLKPFFYLSMGEVAQMSARFIIGSLVLALLSTLGACLTLGAQKGRFIVFLVIAPLLIPLLVLATSFIDITNSTKIGLMVALLLFTLPLALWGGAKILEIHIKS